MGCFSRITCDTNKRIMCGVRKNVYVLIPKEFGGGHIKESCYDDYGHYIYDLVTEWNRQYLEELFQRPDWKCSRPEWECSKEDPLKAIAISYMKEGDEGARKMAEQLYPKKYYLRRDWKRCIGIYLACYDEDNARLPYPIKIAERPNAVYEECEPSKNNPGQGFW